MKPIHLRQARERAGLTQKALEAITGIPQGVISKLERRVSDPRFSTGLKLAKAVAVDPYDLCFGPDAECAA